MVKGPFEKALEAVRSGPWDMKAAGYPDVMTEDELREAEMFGDGETDEVSMASWARQQQPFDTPEYRAFCAEEEAIHEGLATRLTRCETCFWEVEGRFPRQGEQGPLRGILSEGTAYGFDPVLSARQGYDGDPYTTLKLSCGHISM